MSTQENSFSGTKMRKNLLPANDSNYDPDVMKYITPYNFFQVRWAEFEGMVREVLDAFNEEENWTEFAADVYRRTRARYEFLEQRWVKALRFLWRGYKTDLCLGMARSKDQRLKIEKGDPPCDFCSRRDQVIEKTTRSHRESRGIMHCRSSTNGT